jgi:hypothetical protein
VDVDFQLSDMLDSCKCADLRREPHEATEDQGLRFVAFDLEDSFAFQSGSIFFTLWQKLSLLLWACAGWLQTPNILWRKRLLGAKKGNARKRAIVLYLQYLSLCLPKYSHTVPLMLGS